jgi:glyceraldehyde-3-phosphate dehydrogenase (NAD(P))
MNALTVGVVGYGRVGRRVADAVARQPDMRPGGVYEPDEARRRLATACGHAVASGDFRAWAATCGVLVNCEEALPAAQRAVVHGPESRQQAPRFTALAAEEERGGWHEVKVPCADAVAFARLLAALRDLGPITRLYATTVRRGERVDSLEPVFAEGDEDAELLHLLAGRIAAFHVLRVRAPYTHSQLHFLKLDLAAPCARDDAVRALRAERRVTVARAADGFPDTAHVQEFYRDLGRPRADRPELFVWEESVAVEGGSLYFFVDVAPDATPVPEIIDACRLLGHRGLSLADSAALTDRALGLAGDGGGAPGGNA